MRMTIRRKLQFQRQQKYDKLIRRSIIAVPEESENEVFGGYAV